MTAADRHLTPAGGDGDDCTCLVRAAEIELSLRRQARLEAALLRRLVPDHLTERTNP